MYLGTFGIFKSQTFFISFSLERKICIEKTKHKVGLLQLMLLSGLDN